MSSWCLGSGCERGIVEFTPLAGAAASAGRGSAGLSVTTCTSEDSLEEARESDENGAGDADLDDPSREPSSSSSCMNAGCATLGCAATGATTGAETGISGTEGDDGGANLGSAGDGLCKLPRPSTIFAMFGGRSCRVHGG